jgi:hypothetical protein
MEKANIAIKEKEENIPGTYRPKMPYRTYGSLSSLFPAGPIDL